MTIKAPSKNVSLREQLTTVRAPILADIKKMRVFWAQGHTDREIRDEMNLDFRAWKKRIRIMRAVPADEDVVGAFKRYHHEHSKTIEKLHLRLAELSKIYKIASEEIPVYSSHVIDKKTKQPKLLHKKPRDLHLAANTMKDMAALDKIILDTEERMLEVKQRLGMIEPVAPESFNPFGEASDVTITAPNLVAAWRIRNERMRQKKLQAPEEATIVNDEGTEEA